jgi:3'-phosphoadenosine 5'-phosphosulfate sulfotransferase (PAPS reductase)/FAD synthetase
MKILQFSGGIDSLACLYLLKAEWDTLHIVWVNTGAAYPETFDLMDKVKERVPNFHEVQSNKSEWAAQHGIGVAVVPANSTHLAQTVRGTQGQRYTSYLNCCGFNIWAPMANKCKELGVTTVVRGQRLGEDYKSIVRDGDVIEGVKYEFPLENWTRELVFRSITRPSSPAATAGTASATLSTISCGYSTSLPRNGKLSLSV